MSVNTGPMFRLGAGCVCQRVGVSVQGVGISVLGSLSGGSLSRGSFVTAIRNHM